MLSYRYSLTGNIYDSETAIWKAELLVSATPEDHPDQIIRLNNIGSMLSDVYSRIRNIHDLEVAISKAELPFSTTPENY